MNRIESMSFGEQEALEQKEDPKHIEENIVSEPPVESADTISAEHLSEEGTQTSHEESQIKETKHKQAYDNFLSELEKLNEPEAKLEKAIAFMESTLSQTATPHFKSFWDARNLSLELFKQNISQQARAALWSKYTDLSKEARRLKEILEEQSAFAAEQIDIAIKALENDIENNSQNLTLPTKFSFGITINSLEPKMDKYVAIQNELNLLNAQAARINALRKELIRTEMRIRQKNKFFQRLSVAGDKVFPKRKELIKDVSQQFMNDIDEFIQNNFKDDIHESLFTLREEIKALQGMAKLLTLNTHSFTNTRLRLSECWDKLKAYEKDRKKARNQQKSIFKQNSEVIQKMIQELSESFTAAQLSAHDAIKKCDEIINQMRQVELGREEVKSLKDELNELRKQCLDKIKAEENERLEQEQERERNRKKRSHELKKECEALLASVENSDGDKLSAEKELLQEKINSTQLTKLEKQELERLLKPLRDIIADKKERALLDLSEDDRAKLQHLKELLKEKKERRLEIKNQLEIYRKAQANSGLDFEQAMAYKSQMADEKERLEKINQGIREVEELIEDIENRS